MHIRSVWPYNYSESKQRSTAGVVFQMSGDTWPIAFYLYLYLDRTGKKVTIISSILNKFACGKEEFRYLIIFAESHYLRAIPLPSKLKETQKALAQSIVKNYRI